MPGAKGKSGARKRKLSDKAFLAIGNRHLAEDFPNPTRQGCPEDSVLKLAAEHPAQMSEETLNHITLCSPCYNLFGDFLGKAPVKSAHRKPTTRSAKASQS
ncbi:MAG TPA: hypothetical protein VFW94_02235 [Candidatus Acidoferrales bacterium]|nr:hypothetical protein [Candidatus Acidoferrales bacterium]